MDNAEPSTNGVSARNLNRLASMLDDEKYTTLANRTATAFEAEIMQHPFLFVGMLESIVAARLGAKAVVVTGDGAAVDRELRKMRAQTSYGRTLVRLGGGARDSWLRQRSGLLKAMDPARASVQVCEDGVCREVLVGENAA
jgi:uncharacterized protein YyaL (SSP411 family)